MAGLQALQNYGSDSSSESEEESRTAIVINNKKRKLELTMGHAGTDEKKKGASRNHVSELPLPSEILSMFSKDANSSETSNSSDHQRRVRSFAHVPGNWATYVFIPCNTASLCALTETLMTYLPQDLTFHPCDDLHLSLSRTVCLQFHWIEPFTQSLRERIDGMRAFQCHVEQVKIYTNDENTRTFLGLKIGAGHESLCKVTELTDECLKEFSLPVFYKNPSFHMSFCWCVGDVSARITPAVLKKLQDTLYSHQGDLSIDVKDVQCKSGCKTFVFQLR